MKVSIITVCLDSEATIRNAIQSVAEQTHPAIEYLVVDGESSDGTLGIVAEFPAVVTRVVSERDSGIYDAMNKGVGLATGDVVYFLNSDDVLHDAQVIADVADAFDRAPEIELVYGNVVYVKPGKMEHRVFSHVTRRNLLFGDLCHQAVFARRELFASPGLFETRFRINADYDWLLRVFLSRHRVAYFDRDVAYFNAAGRHVADEHFLRRERLAVRMQYCSRASFALGDLYYRIRRKLRTLGKPASA